MATAVEPSSTPSAPGKLLSLPAASLVGAIYTLAALAVVYSLLPAVWAEHVTPRLDRLLDWMCWIPAVAVTVVALIWFGRKLAGDAAPRGVHGGVFLMVSAFIAIFFLARAVGMWVEGTPGMVLAGAVAVGLFFVAFRYFTGRTGQGWMVSLEEQGWFSLAQYKRSLGVRVRRITILGILLVGGSGAWSLYNQGALPDRWTLAMPFEMQPLTIMYGAQAGILVTILLISLWVGFRAVNVPEFAEFLIATEAEMNKVSWSTRRRLAQDTIVVLITTLIMTLFLLVVDLFWGWLLSRERVGVLPARATNQEKGQVQEVKW